ncbi:MAG TPA: hypothetical protein VJG49_04140 [Candidatus Nanoarchaeia archaeon]|nr:hypothetical protein [Candidatus Nanoarchaeia archaeon]
MKLTFLGTKGYVEESSSKHRYHSSLLLEYRNFRLLIDHGLLSKKLRTLNPGAILITHGHPDTFKWLKENEEYAGKIYVTSETKKLSRFPQNFVLLKLNRWLDLGPFKVLAYRVVHSVLAPAVGFKIKAGKTLIYNSDLVVPKNKAILNDVDLYIGDGSSVRGNLVRKKNGQLFGHARISTQLRWCQQYGIKKVIFTHFGKEALRIGDKRLTEMLQKKFPQKGLKIMLAYDGWSYNLL